MARVLLYERVPDPWFDGLAQSLEAHQADDLDLELAQPPDDDLDSALALLAETDILLVGLAGQQRAVVRHVFEAAPGLTLVQKLGSRTVGLDLVAAAELGVPVSLIPVPAHVACAEHTLLLILALAKKLLQAHRAITAEKADQEPRPTCHCEYAYNWAGLRDIGLLAGRTLGLVGMGDIAVEVARRARAFDMPLLYTDEQPLPDEEEQELGARFRALDDLLAEADVVSLHAAHTPRTEKLIDSERLERMKPSAILVNTARGGLVDEDALIAALCKDRIAGAALDVWAEEPAPRDNPLLALDNVLATPHIAAGTLPDDALYQAVLPNLLAALRGEPIQRLLTLPPPPRTDEPPDEREEKTRPPGTGLADEEPEPPEEQD